MGQALYRKYRSENFDEVIGQDHITKSLRNTVNSNSLAHAYLFVGPRGVGKTSVARILAYEANGVSYGSINTQLDIIEIDAASNRRIDEVRELRQKINIAPANAKYKVYIIDEVHMLTKEAHNALLKTLEEPPTHVIFILATTEISKIPDTIVSRCVRFTFKPIPKIVLEQQLAEIAEKEKIKIDKPALSVISEHADGSMRDALSLLDQVRNWGSDIGQDVVEEALGIPAGSTIDNLISAINTGDRKLVHSQISNLWEVGTDPVRLASALNDKLTVRFMANSLNLSSSQTVELLNDLLEVPSSYNPKSRLQLSLLKHTSSKNLDNIMSMAEPVSEPETIEPELDIKNESSVESSSDDFETNSTWETALSKIKKENNTLYGIARMAMASEDDERIILTFRFPFHQKKFEDPSNRKVLEGIIKSTSDKQLVVALAENNAKNSNTKKVEGSDLSTITNIFGSTEVLES